MITSLQVDQRQPMQSFSGYRPDIDGLRAIAISLVLAFHVCPSFAPGGFVGVDVFFVISGYLIGGIVLDSLYASSFSLWKFYARRVRRIFPALTVVLLAGYALGWNLLLADEFKQLGQDVAAGAAFAANLAVWAQTGYFDRAAETKPFLHLWSLGIEEQFYIVWPLLLWAIWRNRRIGAVVLYAVIVASFLLNVHLTGTDRAAAFYSPLSRCWELACGTALFYWIRSQSASLVTSCDSSDSRHSYPGLTPTSAGICSIIGLAAILAPASLITRDDKFPGLWATLPVAGSVLMIFAGQAAALNRLVLSSRPFVALGLISYSIYLWHWPLLSFLHIAYGGEPPISRLVGAVVTSILLAAATYVFIERPVRAGALGRRQVLSIAGTLVAVGAVGLFTFLDNGISSRYPTLIQKLTDANFSITNESRLNKCFLSEEQEASKFADECFESDRRPLVFLWGDSHAATMYPGLKSMQKMYDFGIAQYTSSACPPVPGVANPSRPLCKSVNDFVITKIGQTKPDIVLLEAGWFTEPPRLYGPGYNGDMLDQTVAALRLAGVNKIVVFGTSPFWPEPLSQILVNEWKSDPMHRTPSLRLKSSTWESMVQYDDRMRAVAARLKLKFISVKDILCNAEEGCLTRLAMDQYDITSFDATHLTPPAANYVMQEAFHNGGIGALLFGLQKTPSANEP